VSYSGERGRQGTYGVREDMRLTLSRGVDLLSGGGKCNGLKYMTVSYIPVGPYGSPLENVWFR
jgi:hypothetical protein